MDKVLINSRMANLGKQLDAIKEKGEKEIAEKMNQVLQDFVIWLKGYLDNPTQ